MKHLFAGRFSKCAAKEMHFIRNMNQIAVLTMLTYP